MEKVAKPQSGVSAEISELPVLPLRDVVVYPHMVIPLFVGREKSVRALETAMAGDKRILLVAQRSPDVDDPQAGDLYSIGTVATVLQLLKLPDGTIKVLVEGASRAEVVNVADREGLLMGFVRVIEPAYTREAREIEVVSRSLVSMFEQFVKLNRKIPPELLTTLAGTSGRTALLRSLTVLFGAAFVLRYIVLESLYAPTGGTLAKVLTVLLEGVSLGALQYEPAAPATGYLAFLALALYLVGLFLLRAPHPQELVRGSRTVDATAVVRLLVLCAVAGTLACARLTL